VLANLCNYDCRLLLSAFRVVLVPSDPSQYANRDRCSQTPTGCLAAEGGETCAFGNCRSLALGMAITRLGAMALSIGDRQTGDCDRLAAEGISAVLDLEEQRREDRATACGQGSAEANLRDQHGESTLGSATRSWRVAEAGNYHLASDGGEVHGASTEAALANVADLP